MIYITVVIGDVEVLKSGKFPVNIRENRRYFPLKKFYGFYENECEKDNNIFSNVEIKKIDENFVYYVKSCNLLADFVFNRMFKSLNSMC